MRRAAPRPTPPGLNLKNPSLAGNIRISGYGLSHSSREALRATRFNPCRGPLKEKTPTENGLQQTPTKAQNPHLETVTTNARIFLVNMGCAGVVTNERMNE